MLFDYSSPQVINSDLDKVCFSFKRLMANLAIRTDNNFCFSGEGGNNFQLLVFMCLKHALVPGNNPPQFVNDGIIWSTDWLVNNNDKVIRANIDDMFNDIPEHYKYLAVMLNNGNDMRSVVSEYKAYLPKLSFALAGNVFKFDESFSKLERLIVACIVCCELSARLDAGDQSTVSSSLKTLHNMSADILIFAIRKYIGIDRLIKYDIDEHVDFNVIGNKVNKLADS